jgi:hypothetical protein
MLSLPDEKNVTDCRQRGREAIDKREQAFYDDKVNCRFTI